MKHALSSEGPARVRRGHFRAFTLGVGASALAMACSFGEIDNEDPSISPTGEDDPAVAPTDSSDDPGGATDGRGNTSKPSTSSPSVDEPEEEDYDPNDPFSSIQGQEVKEILQTYCGDCHIGNSPEGDFGYLLKMDELVANEKMVPGSRDDSQIYVRMVGGQMPPAYYRDVNGQPSYQQIEVVGRFIDELEYGEPEDCEPLPFVGVDEQIELMADDIRSLNNEADQPFTRYLTLTYASNAGLCGRDLDTLRYALFKGINSVSTDPVITQPVAIDQNETIYRIDIRDYGWNREIDLLDNNPEVNGVDFADGWEAIVGDPRTSDFALEYQGEAADDLKADAQTAIPFLPVNVFIQSTQFGDTYYTLIGGKQNLFQFELDVLKIDTAAKIADNDLMRAGFSNSGVSRQERVLNRFDSGIAGNLNYWISFDFDGGAGGEAAVFEASRANESIFADPLGFAFAGGEAIFSLPNGLQAYYVAKADGGRLAEAPVGVVIDPAQNNGLVTNGASCNSCHNAGMIPFRDTVRQFVEDNKQRFSNDVYEDVLEQYVDFDVFKAAMDRDSEVHIAAAEKAGVPRGKADTISRVYINFQKDDITASMAAGELGVSPEELLDNVDLLDPQLGPLGTEGGFIDRNKLQNNFFESACALQAAQENVPVGCP